MQNIGKQINTIISHKSTLLSRVKLWVTLSGLVMATGVIVLHGVELANDNATQTTELPEDGPWNLDPIKLSQAAGNTVAQSIDNGNGALVPDIDAPWALSGEQLSQITNNSKPIPPAPKPIDPSTQSNAFNT